MIPSRLRRPPPVFAPIPKTHHCLIHNSMRTISRNPWSFFQVADMQRTKDDCGDVTLLLDQVRQGHPDALDRLTRSVYDELHKLAHSKMRKERNGHILQTTALVNEAIVRLLDGNVLARSPNRRYLFAAASKAMRFILVNHGRRRRLDRRSTIEDPSLLEEILVQIEGEGAPIEELNRALQALEQIQPRQSQVVDMRFFGGYSVAETAVELDVSISTVENDFRIARAWLRAKIERSV